MLHNIVILSQNIPDLETCGHVKISFSPLLNENVAIHFFFFKFLCKEIKKKK